MALNGYTVTCGRKTGGIKRIGLIAASDVKSVTVADSAVTAITLNTSAKFRRYEFQQDQAELTIGGSGTSVDISIDMWLEKMSAAGSKAINEILDSLPCGVMALVELANGESCLVGYSAILGANRPIKTASLGGTSGRAFADDSYQQITLTVSQPDEPLYLSSSVEIDTLYAA